MHVSFYLIPGNHKPGTVGAEYGSSRIVQITFKIVAGLFSLQLPDYDRVHILLRYKTAFPYLWNMPKPLSGNFSWWTPVALPVRTAASRLYGNPAGSTHLFNVCHCSAYQIFRQFKSKTVIRLQKYRLSLF